MEHKKMFESMSPEGKRFYSRVFNTAVLNLHAVRTGLFDTLLCETEDPRVTIRWKKELPRIIEIMQIRKSRGMLNDEPGE